MVDFLYFGEANVYQENLDSFLAVAEELQLKGLMGSGAEEEVKENNKPTAPKKSFKTSSNKNYTKQEVTIPELTNSVERVERVEGTIADTDYTVAADLQHLNDKIKSMMMVSENHLSVKLGRARICKVCGKEGQWSHIRDHIEANHITGVTHTCNICGKISRTRGGIRRHKYEEHRS